MNKEGMFSQKCSSIIFSIVTLHHRTIMFTIQICTILVLVQFKNKKHILEKGALKIYKHSVVIKKSFY
jgi:hypothetical protein